MIRPGTLKEHPFSFSSSASSQNNLEFTIKQLGDFTRTIKHTKVGDIAYLDGPYGAFSIDLYAKAPDFIFIAGGVGGAPILSMLRTLADRGDNRTLWFVFANNTWQDVTFREALDALKIKLDLHLVHVLTQAPEGWQGESGFVTPALLKKVLPNDAKNYECFLCGPKPMSDAAQKGLQSLHVPMDQIHFELFDMV